MTFGDWDPDDALDHEPPAPEQVAYRLHALRMEVDALTGAANLPTWDELTPAEQQLGESMAGSLVTWLAEHDPDDPEQAARSLHNVRRYIASSRLPAWEDLDEDDRQIGVDLMSLILGWLRRQGAIA
jgi:hypothetical protein